MLLQVPYDRGWKITVNGKETTYQKAFDGLMEIQLPAGECRIEMRYCPPGLKMGTVFTIVGIVAFCIWSITEVRIRKRKTLSNRNEKIRSL